MKTRLFFILLLVSGFTVAQDLPDLKAYSNDIGFNTSFLLNGVLNSSGSPFDLMLKKQKSSHQANRFGIELYTDISTNVYGGSGFYYQNDNYSLSISFGKEKQHQLSKRWIFYYGGDIAPFYNFNAQDYYSNSNLQNKYDEQNFGLRLSPFLGIRFQINDRLYVATEALLRVAYSRKEINSKSYDSNGMIYSESNKSFNNFRLQALPATGLSLFYRF
jgi:hypothetical protein